MSASTARRAGTPPKTERNREVVRLRVEEGWAYKDLARRYGVSHARIGQILSAAGVDREAVKLQYVRVRIDRLAELERDRERLRMARTLVRQAERQGELRLVVELLTDAALDAALQAEAEANGR